MARIRIFTGHFGSGKTEVAVNYALRLAEGKEWEQRTESQEPKETERKQVCLVDLDVVNPYFCSRDVASLLQKHGIRVISANPSLSNAELGVISPEVMAIFDNPGYEVVLDVGGDDVGAVALGQFNRYFRREPYDMYFLVNTKRPLTADRAGVRGYIRSIEAASRLRVTHLISNTNLSFATTVEDILAGDALVWGLAGELGIPHRYTVYQRQLAGQVEGKIHAEPFAIETYIKTPWM